MRGSAVSDDHLLAQVTSEFYGCWGCRMCGIVGYSGRFESAGLEAAVAALRHRGPDDCGTFLERAAGVGLGHSRLSILDLSPLGHQPMADSAGNAVIVFNGEIYNFHDLRRALEAKGVGFRGHSDTEVLLQLYLDRGEAMLPALNGIFAFAIWDSRRRGLLIARDGLGVKPLYVAETGRGVAFASEIKALVELAPESRTIDVPAMQRYLSFLWCPGSGTPLKEVRKLPPGGLLWVEDGAVVRREQWYRLPVFRGVEPSLSGTDSVQQVEAGLRTAVHRQMVSDVPLGAFLSGGLDSSAVACFARELNPNINCFTIDVGDDTEQGATDDLPYARAVARHLGVRLHEIRVDAGAMAGKLEAMVYQLDEPLADPAALNVYYISRLAREHGIKVLLSGAGGDDLFSGYRRHRAVEWQWLWSLLPAGLRRGLDRGAAGLDQRRALSRRLAKLLGGVSLDDDGQMVNYFVWGRAARLAGLFTREARAEFAAEPAAEPMMEFLAEMPRGVAPLEKLLALEQRFFLADHNLIYSDKMSMAVGVEARVPFLDADLVELAARIPAAVKQRHGVGKWVLKQAMASHLPRDIIHRPKSGFGAPVRRWIHKDLRPLVRDVLSPGSLSRRGIFDPAAVGALVEDNDAGRLDASYTLLSLTCIELWMRQFIDGRGPEPLAG
jgi:asparagine synthase (glutamine-hydrolysing)